jgi:hypothetical protein
MRQVGDKEVRPKIATTAKWAAHQSPPGWEPFSRAGIAAPFPGRFHRKGEPLPSYLAVAENLRDAGHAVLDEFLAQHDPNDPDAPPPDELARRLTGFRLVGARVLVADAPHTLSHFGIQAQEIQWRDRTAWDYCQNASDFAKTLQLDGVICTSAVNPDSCQTLALFREALHDALRSERSSENTVTALRRELDGGTW